MVSQFVRLQNEGEIDSFRLERDGDDGSSRGRGKKEILYAIRSLSKFMSRLDKGAFGSA